MKFPTISVENFGPIREGIVDLRPLTIFTGQSDTGKSWLATLIYALYSVTDTHSSIWYTQEAIQNFLKKKSEEQVIKFPDNIENWRSAIENNDFISFSETEHLLLSECMAQASLQIVFEIERCFGVDNYKELESWHSKGGTQIGVSFNTTDGRRFRLFDHLAKDDGITTKTYFPKAVNFSTDRNVREVIYSLLDGGRDQRNNQNVERLVRNVLVYAYRQALKAQGAFYLPSGRVGLMESFNSLVPSLIEKYSQRTREMNNTAEVPPGILSDFIASLARVGGVKLEKRDQTVLETARRVENFLLEGEVDVKSNSFGMPYFQFASVGTKKSASLKLLSSKVKQLAPLVVFLRYIIDKESFVIIEEPEVHLHPSQQVLLVTEICRWVAEGYRVVITTHSEWFIEALRNVLASRGANIDSNLCPDQVGVWNFSSNAEGTGSVIKEVKWDQDFGGYQTGFEETASLLHNSWVDANQVIE